MTPQHNIQVGDQVTYCVDLRWVNFRVVGFRNRKVVIAAPGIGRRYEIPAEDYVKQSEWNKNSHNAQIFHPNK